MIDRKFKSDVVFGYATQGAVVACGFLFMLTVTHFGSVATYGALMLLVSVSSVLGNLVSFRTNEALVAFYKKGETLGDWGRCKFSIIAGMCLDALVGATLFALLYFNDRAIAALLLKDPDAGAEVALYGLVILATALRSTPLAYLQATDRIKVVNAITLAEHLAKLAIAAAAGFALQTLDLRTVVFAALAPAACAVVVAYLPLARAMFTRLRAVATCWERGLARDYARFSLSTFTSSALKAGNQNIDTLILGALTDTRTAGIYATFRQFLSPLAFLTGPFEAIAYPRFVKAVVERRHVEMRDTIARINRKLMLAFGVGTTVITVATVTYAQIAKLQLDATGYSAFAFLAAAALLRGQVWWSRAFSNAVNPNLSLTANFLATLFLLVALYPATLALGLAGTALGMLALAVLLTVYWVRTLARYA